MYNLLDRVTPKTKAILASIAIETVKRNKVKNEILMATIQQAHSDAKLEDRIRTQTKQYEAQFIKQGVR